MSHGPRSVPVQELEIAAASGWRRLPMIAGVVGAAGIVLSVLLGRSDPKQLYFSWLVAVLYFLSLGLGCLFFVLIHHASKAGWGIVVRRLAENVAAAVPVLFVLFAVPVYFGMHDLYHWSDAEAVAHDEILAGKAGYLNPTFFWVRVLVIFAVWTALTWWFRSTSRRQDASGDQRLSARMIWLAGPSLVLFALTVTFAAFDWIMTIDAHWYSTIFGVYYFAGCVVAGFATLCLVALALKRTGYLEHAVTAEHFHDLGKLLFAFVVFWTYIAFSQFLLIWYANLPEETEWFLRRYEGSWHRVSVLLAWSHFVIPFFFLMPRTIKRRRPLLAIGATWMLLVHYLDLHWLIMPNLHAAGFQPSLLDLTTLLGVGGVFVAVAGALMLRGPLVPLRDPRLLESLAFENF